MLRQDHKKPPADNTDPLYSWKKHSGFKKGLATDIILGDMDDRQTPSASLLRTSSTMHTDYTPKNVRVLDGVVPAGKSLGFAKDGSAKTENHIVFGDEKMVSGSERHVSVTNTDYKHHSYVKPDITKPGESVAKKSNSLSHSIVQKYHSKAQTATSMAHIGLQTRQDLPIDDQHFSSYVTTSQDAYGGPIDVSESIALRAQVQTSHQGRPSHIQFGDSDKLHLYETEHDSAFHAQNYTAYGDEGGKRVIVKGSNRSSIVFGHIERDPVRSNDSDMYVSTSMSAYVPSHPASQTRSSSLVVQDKNAGKSSIPFGESLDERRVTQASVTQRDYIQKPLPPQVSGDRSHVTVEDSPGILKALNPDGTTMDANQSLYSTTFKPASENESGRKHMNAAGGGKGGPRGNQSSVAMGDNTHFDFHHFSTSTSEYFIPHPPDPTLTHPILGAQMTKSKVQLGDQESLLEVGFDQYATTTHGAFIAYSPKDAQKYRGIRVKPHGSLVVNNDHDPAYSMIGNQTTHQAHFEPQSFAHRQGAIKPHLASKRMLFPLETNQPSHYETTSGAYFSMRDGLLKNRYKPSKVSRESAIVFGDPKYTYFSQKNMS